MLFEKVGRENTKAAVELALKTAKEQGIHDVVVASVTGETALMLKNTGLNVVCVAHVDGFETPGENTMPKAVRKELEDAGIPVVVAAHVLSGAERSISGKASGMYPVEVMAATLRMFGQGVKVCVECAVMAADAGLVPFGSKVVSIGGTGRGADAVMVLTPAYTSTILQTKIHEIVCKPAL